MSYKTNPNLNRLKIIKGWKSPYLPTKTLNYARDISLWFKVYLLLKTFLNLKKIQLLSFEIRFDQQKKKILYLILNPKKTPRKKKRRRRISLMKIQTPMKKIKNFGARFFLLQNFQLFKNFSFWNQNPVQKKILSKFWLTKPKNFIWIHLLENIASQRQIAKRKFKFWKINQSFLPKQHLKLKLLTLKQKQILTKKIKIKKSNAMLSKKLFVLSLQKNSKIFHKEFQSLKEKLQKNQTDIKKIEKIYAFLWSLNRTQLANQKKNTFQTLTQNKFQRQKFQIWLKNFKKALHSVRFFRNPNLSLALQKKNIFLGKILRLNLLIAQMQKKNFFGKKKITETNLFLLSNQKFRNFVKKKYSQRLKKKQRRFLFSKLLLFYFLQKRRKKKKSLGQKLRKNKGLTLKKTSFGTYLQFLEEKKWTNAKAGHDLTRKLKEINTYIKKNQVAKNYQYRLPLKKAYFSWLQLDVQLKFKYLIQNFVQKYFSIPIETKVIYFLNAYKNKKSFRLVFPIWKKKKKQKIRKFRQKSWKQKQIFFASQLQFITSTKKNTQNPANTEIQTVEFLENTVKLLKKNERQTLIRKKMQNARIMNSFRRIKSNKDFRQSFKYFLPTLSYFSRTLDPRPLADLLAKVIYRAKKQTFMLGTVQEILKILRLSPKVGYKVALAGRINSADKSRLIYIKKKNVPLQVFNKNMNYAYAQAKARIGVFGIKIWVYF